MFILGYISILGGTGYFNTEGGGNRSVCFCSYCAAMVSPCIPAAIQDTNILTPAYIKAHAVLKGWIAPEDLL